MVDLRIEVGGLIVVWFGWRHLIIGFNWYLDIFNVILVEVVEMYFEIVVRIVGLFFKKGLNCLF